MSTPTPPGPPGDQQPSGPPQGWPPPGQGQPPYGQGQPPQYGQGQQPGPGQPQYGQGQPPQWQGYDPNRYQQQGRPQDGPPEQTRVFNPNGPGGFNGPPGYQRPPQKNRAGLFIVLMVVMLVAVLGIGGVVAYNLVGDDSDSTAPAGPSFEPSDVPSDLPTDLPTEEPTISAPTEVPTKVPTNLPTTGTGDQALAKQLAQRFIGNLNANNTKGALALGCKESKEVLPLLFEALIAPPTKLTIGEALGESTVLVRVSGSTKGRNVTGLVVVMKPAGESLCVRVLSLTPS